MQCNSVNSFEWTQRYLTQEVCLEELNRHRWKNGFICPKCSHAKSWHLMYSLVHHCAKCGREVSPTAGTVSKSTSLPLPKWFVAIYLMGTDKSRIFVERLSKMIGVSWLIAYRMLRKLRHSMRTVAAVAGSRGLLGWAMLSSGAASRAREVAGLRVKSW